jgi:hypothetical protein
LHWSVAVRQESFCFSKAIANQLLMNREAMNGAKCSVQMMWGHGNLSRDDIQIDI